MREIEELVNDAKNGDKKAFEKLILSVQNDLQRIANHNLSQKEDIQDAIQNTLIKAYIGIEKLRDNKYFKTWIIAILINECRAIYRKNKVNIEVITDDIKIEEFNDENIDFEYLVKSLNEKEKNIFELRYKHDKSIKEISKILDIKENVVKSILHRGKEKLKRRMSKATIMIFILSLLITNSVMAVSLISYIHELFDISNIENENNGVLTMIENFNTYDEFKEYAEKYNIIIEY